jgi:hypothetical protein
MKIPLIFASLAIPALACGQSASTCPMLAQHQEVTDSHAAGVDARGDHAMGFPHDKSAHHFRLYPDGGAIQVVANDPNDTVTRDEIRVHLNHIVQLFMAGDFQVPMFIHDTVPPGVPVMESKKGVIVYAFEATQDGGRVRITTADAEALKAVHQFLDFQIEDHRTGDPKIVAPPR